MAMVVGGEDSLDLCSAVVAAVVVAVLAADCCGSDVRGGSI